MRLRFGRYAGMTAEAVLLRAPDYVEWVLRFQGPSRLGAVFQDLVARFDAKPIAAPCVVCREGSALAFAYLGQSTIIIVCKACATGLGAGDMSSLRRVGGFSEALRHVDATFRRRRREGKRQIVRALTKAKGGPTRITESSAQAFLRLSDARQHQAIVA